MKDSYEDGWDGFYLQVTEDRTGTTLVHKWTIAGIWGDQGGSAGSGNIDFVVTDWCSNEIFFSDESVIAINNAAGDVDTLSVWSSPP